MNVPLPTLRESTLVAGDASIEPPRGSRGAELALVLFFLALTAGSLVLQTLVELRRGEGVRALDVFRQKPTSANLRAYERNLEDASIAGHALRPLFQFAQFAWLRDGGEKALVGRDGWLFYKPGFDATLARATPFIHSSAHPFIHSDRDPVGAIVAWRDALTARGIHLLVVPVPNKESIYPDPLTRRIAAGQIIISPTTRDLLSQLKSARVECVDLFSAFDQARTGVSRPPAPLYLRQDSHWSAAGVAIAANAVAIKLIELGWAEPGEVEYRERSVAVERPGDVLRMLQSSYLDRSVEPEKVLCAQVIRVESGQLYLDDPESQILVLGDSFLRIYEQDEPGAAGFVAHLAKELKQPLASFVSDGGASTLVRQELSRRPALLKNKRVAVWEFVERDIHLGTEGWQIVPLPPIEAETRNAHEK